MTFFKLGQVCKRMVTGQLDFLWSYRLSVCTLTINRAIRIFELMFVVFLFADVRESKKNIVAENQQG
jgi:hypothetical protein